MKLAILLICLMQVSAVANGQQQKTISGNVALNGDPLPGVTVVVKGTIQGTVTDVDGNYSITSVPDNATLVFSFLGMISQEISVAGQTQINVAMAQDFIGIEEVVAIGYGTMKKSDLTGSVASVTPEQLVDRPLINVGQALQNKIAGVQVIKQSTGAPGSSPQIRIRGTNSIQTNADPLFVVDGIVGVNNALQNINPQDIASLNILKDASATAIYGTRGANGVIIITTKRGAVGDIRVNYNGSVSVGIMTRHNYTVTADQFMYLYEQAFTNTPKYGTLKQEKDFRGPNAAGASWSEMPWLFEKVPQGSYFMDFIGNDGNYYKPRFYTNWEDEAFSTSLSHNNHVDVSGGTEKAKYSFTLGNTNENGLMLESYNNRINTRMTLDLELSKWLEMSVNIAYSRTDRARGDDQTRTVSETWPILPANRYPDEEIYGIYAGKYATGRDFNVGENWRGINYVMEEQDGYYLDNQLTGSVVLNAKITEDLSFKTDLSVDNRSTNSRWARGTYQGNRTAEARGSNQLWQYWQNQNYFNYNKTIGDHVITGMLGLSWSENLYDAVEARAYNFSSNFYSWNNLHAGTNTPRVYSNNSRGALNSYFTRATYSYQGKYMLTATGRIDGSSKFGSNEKYGFFPSIGGAWRISQEGFMADSNTISNLKLRASAGQTGNQEIGSFVTQRYVNSTSVIMGDGLHAGLYPGSTGNNDLKWETTTQYDLGLDLGLLENRINFVLDVYYKMTDDML
ncbi:MAG: SusC/RagA family TonB-linked outer membrane protein, partial [Draconibacterium sp.]|nr:SusC/RagA family TonB-linked outer membrane protein [Draconibacterium sp.]